MAGCSLTPARQMTHGEKIDLNKFDSLKLCVATKPEVFALVGYPRQQGRRNGYKTATWQYAKLSFSGPQDSQHIIAFFDDSEKLVDYVVNPVGLVQVTDNCK